MIWHRTELSNLVNFGPQYGANARAVRATGSRPRYVRITDIDSDGRLIAASSVEADIQDNSAFLLQEGDLLFARSGNTVGKTYRYSQKDGPCIFAGYLIRFRINPNLADSRFLFYYTHSPTYKLWVNSKRRVAGQPNINGKEYSALKLPFFPLSEQLRIIDILDQADELRKMRVHANSKANGILPAIFYKMFGDPATNPKRWQIKPLSNLGAQIRYGLGQPPKGKETGVPLIRATNISKGTISSKNMITVDPLAIPPGKNAFLKSDEVIVVRSGAYTGDVAQVTGEWEGCVAGYDLVVTPGNFLTGEFVEAYLLTPFIQRGYFQNLKARAGQPHLNAAQVSATPFPEASHNLQVRFSEFVNSLRQFKKQSETASENIECIFAVMLHHAFAGDLTAKWREAHMKELLEEMKLQAKNLNFKEL